MRDQNLEALKSAVSKDRSSGRGKFSDELRVRLIAYAESARGQGQAVERIGRDLGISSKTIHSWLGAHKSSALRRVEVIAERPTPRGGSLSMRGPAGTMVDGLSVDDVVKIWRQLGC